MRKTRGTFQRGPRWYFQCFIRGRRIRRAAGSTMREAERALAEFRRKNALRRDPFSGERISFEELAREYLVKYSRPMKAPSSARMDEGQLVNHLVPYFGDFRLAEITKAAFYEYRAERLQERVLNRDRKVSERTLNSETTLLRHMMSMAVEWGYLETNPLLRVKQFRERPRRRILPLPLLREMIDRAPLPLKHAIIFALNTGARKSEILGLAWDYVNLETRTITLTETKNKKPRDVFINDALLDLLQRLDAERRQRIAAAPQAERAAAGRYVFPGAKPGQPQRDIKQAWGALLRRLGVEDFRFHDLRRCWSTYARGEMAARQQGLGHSSLAMTAAYTVPLEDDMRKMYASFQVWEQEKKIIDIKPEIKGG